MTVETAADRAALLDDFGVVVTWTHDFGATVLTGIYNAPAMMFPGEVEVDLVDPQPTLICRSADLPDGADEGDEVVIEAETGTVTLRCKTLRPDGAGFTIVDLQA